MLASVGSTRERNGPSPSGHGAFQFLTHAPPTLSRLAVAAALGGQRDAHKRSKHSAETELTHWREE
jgi:hypothetical protein